MMKAMEQPPVARWSTDLLPQQDRCTSVVEALGKAIVPVNVSIDDPRDFEFHMACMELEEGVSFLHQTGSAHQSFRGRSELARSGAHTYHFLINRAAGWTLSHHGDIRLAPGEGILVDSAYAFHLSMPADFEVVHIKMSEEWLQRWVPQGADLAGCQFTRDSGLGRALNLFAAQLSPHTLLASPLPAADLAEQFGAMLALAGSDRTGGTRRPVAGLRDGIEAVMRQRCAEPGLRSCDVASDLRIPLHELHDALAASGQIFADLLNRMRGEISLRMLRAPSFRHLSLQEISDRAGFPNVQSMLQCVTRLPGPH